MKNLQKLKERAEDILEKSKNSAYKESSDADIESLVEEFQVYKIELELQNTELKENQERLEKLNRNFYDLFDFSPVGLVILDAEKNIKSCNQAFSKIVNSDKTEIIKKTFSAFIAPEFQDHVYILFKKLQKENKKQSEQIKFIAKDKTIWVQINVDYHQHKDQFIVSADDINFKKEAEIKIKENEAKLQTVVENFPNGSINLIDKELNFELVGGEDYSKHNIKPNIFLNKPINKVLSNEVLDKAEKALKKAFTGQASNYRLKFNDYIYENIVTPIKTENSNQINYALLISYNISELENAKNALNAKASELQKLNSTREKLLSIIAHDLKSPFHAIMSITEMLLKRYDRNTDEKRKMLLSVMLDNLRNTFSLLDNLLTWARAQTGDLKLHKQSLNINDLVNQTIKILQAQAEKKQITISKDVTDCLVFADENAVSTILRNLVSNAVKYTPEGGTVEIKLFETSENNERFVGIKVQDSGVGIPPEMLKELFSVSENQSTKGTNNETGTGLGLVLVHDFVTKSGGEIRVESQENKGSTFYFTLPKVIVS